MSLLVCLRFKTVLAARFPRENQRKLGKTPKSRNLFWPTNETMGLATWLGRSRNVPGVTAADAWSVTGVTRWREHAFQRAMAHVWCNATVCTVSCTVSQTSPAVTVTCGRTDVHRRVPPGTVPRGVVWCQRRSLVHQTNVVWMKRFGELNTQLITGRATRQSRSLSGRCYYCM